MTTILHSLRALRRAFFAILAMTACALAFAQSGIEVRSANVAQDESG